MKNNEDELIKKQNELANQTKKNIKENINKTFIQLLNKKNISNNELEEWKDNVLNNIYTEIDNLKECMKKIKNIEKINNNIDKKEIRINSKSELNNFTSKDIQEINQKITEIFQNEAYNKMNVKEEVENEKVAFFLFSVAKVARISYNQGKQLFNMMKEKYIESNKINKNSGDNENFLKEFSSWVKNIEKENGKKEYENILNQVKIFEKDENTKDKEFLTKLYYDLSLMYFHCNLSFPLVEISFKKKENFNSEEMIDFINRGKNRKVNFIILPSLFSNGIFLQNGKSWVFTYSQKTFKFKDSINETLDKLIEKDKANPENEKKKENLEIKVYCEYKNEEQYITIETNLNILEDKEYNFIFYLKSKIDDKIYTLSIKKKNFKIDKYHEIKKYELKKGEKILFSSDYIMIKK